MKSVFIICSLSRFSAWVRIVCFYPSVILSHSIHSCLLSFSVRICRSSRTASETPSTTHQLGPQAEPRSPRSCVQQPADKQWDRATHEPGLLPSGHPESSDDREEQHWDGQEYPTRICVCPHHGTHSHIAAFPDPESHLYAPGQSSHECMSFMCEAQALSSSCMLLDSRSTVLEVSLMALHIHFSQTQARTKKSCVLYNNLIYESI